MCPDRQILSVYFDGELPERFRPVVEEHLDSCERCGKILASFAALKTKLSSDGQAENAASSCDEDFAAAAMERVWAKLSMETEGFPRRQAEGRRFPQRRLWQKRVSVPLPFAAVAGLLVVFAAGILVYQFSPSRQNISGQAIAASALGGLPNPYYETINEEVFMNPVGNAANMADVIQYLNNSNTDVLDIRLPESRNFRSFGEPKLINATNHTGGRDRQ
jgi:hypothetical protein